MTLVNVTTTSMTSTTSSNGYDYDNPPLSPSYVTKNVNNGENYDFDSLGSLQQNVLDNNLSKSKKEAVLFRRLTERRRKPSKKFRHTQYDPTEYSNNPFIEQFLDNTSTTLNRLKKSNSTNFDDLNNSFDDKLNSKGSNSTNLIDCQHHSQSINQLNNNRCNELKSSFDPDTSRITSLSAINLNNFSHLSSLLTKPSQTLFGAIISQSSDASASFNKNLIDANKKMESKNDTNQVYDRTSYQETDNNNKAKILPFAVSIDQIQSELGKLKMVEKPAPKIISFNSSENNIIDEVDNRNRSNNHHHNNNNNIPQIASFQPSTNKPSNIQKKNSFIEIAPQKEKKIVITKSQPPPAPQVVSKQVSNEDPFASNSQLDFNVDKKKSVLNSVNLASKTRSNSFQRGHYNIVNSARKDSQSPSTQKQASQDQHNNTKSNENSENIKPNLTTSFNNKTTSSPQPTGSQQGLTNSYQNKKLKTTDTNGANEPMTKTVIHIGYNGTSSSSSSSTSSSSTIDNNRKTPTPSNNSKVDNTVNTGNNINRTVIHKPSSQQPINNNVLTENNKNVDLNNNDIPSWKLELIKRKRTSNTVSAATLIEIEEGKINKMFFNDNNGFKSNSINNFSANEKPVTKTTIGTIKSNNSETGNNTYKTTTITIEPSSKTKSPTTGILQHSSSSASITKLKPTFINNPLINTSQQQQQQTQNQLQQHNTQIIKTNPIVINTNTNNSDIPEWKRTLLEKKKLKKYI